MSDVTKTSKVFGSAIAPGVYICTDVEATIDRHDDGTPFATVRYLRHWLEDSHGDEIDPNCWPVLSEYLAAVRRGRELHGNVAEAWAEHLEDVARTEQERL